MLSHPFFRAFLVSLAVLIIAAPAALTETGDEHPESPLRKVTFTFTPKVYYERVFLAGTFNGWSTDATPMQRTHRRFEVTLLLASGEYQYKFVADGDWITDEKAERFHPDGFGGRNSVILVDDSFEAVNLARGDGQIMLDGLRHGEDAWERSLNADATVTLRVRAWKGDVEWVLVQSLGVNEIPEADTLNLVDSDGTHDYYETHLASGDLAYYFELIDGNTRAFIDQTGGRITDVDDLSMFRFDAAEVVAFKTPDWVKQGIIYQIFPERFANGSTDNDPDFSEWYYEGLTELPPSGKTNGEYFHLMDDWYETAGLKLSPYRMDGKPDWNSFYGGDIEGVRQNLDYLEDLGITAIYFNPVFEAKSNHKYDAASYMKIDTHFGTNDGFAAFVAECHNRGIRVIIDLAFNHTGHTFSAFVEAREKGTESAYWDWYEWNKWPVPGTIVWTPSNALDYYDCWWSFGQMPSLNFDLAATAADENAITGIEDAEPNWALVNHLLGVAEFWLAEIDVDGYRLDVADEVPPWFWELFRERVRSVKPDAYIVGEFWGSSPAWVNGRYFDAVMNYKFFRDPVVGFIAKGEIDAEEFDRALARGRLVYPREGVAAMMNLLGSHDTERFLTVAGSDVRRLKLAMLFAMTYVGAPTIYYGDEIAMTGGGDPDCRRPFYWKWPDESGRVEIRDYVCSLTALRRQHACLSKGGFETLLTEGALYAFKRTASTGDAIIVMNAGRDEATAEVPVDSGVTGVEDALRGGRIPVTKGVSGPVFTVTMSGISGSVFIPASP